MEIEGRLRVLRQACKVVPPVAAPTVRRWVLGGVSSELHGDLTVRSVTGSPLNVSLADFHGLPFAAQGYHTWRSVLVAALAARRGDTIIEVGANVGTETVSYADVAREVIAIEPDPANLARLEQLRGLGVRILPCAASYSRGTLRFRRPPDSHLTGIGHLDQAGELEVQVTTVDAMASDIDVAAILTDTEGHETHVLRRAAKTIERCRPVIVVESEPQCLARAGSSELELQEQLRRHGYGIWRMVRWGLSSELAPGNWLALPLEDGRQGLFQKALVASALLPPFINPVFRRSPGRNSRR